jgi:NAD(P)-dependent dehydrogenase (short-subunit alcohol dehydrogenase family)
MSAIVTGGAKGIGEAIARRLHGQMPVAIWDVDIEAGQQLAATLGDGTIALKVDVADRADVDRAYEETQRLIGPPKVLVNNAGVREVLSFIDVDDRTWRRVLDINLGGVFHCSQAFVREAVRRDDGGVIVNITSAAGLTGFGGRHAYTASKHAVVGLTKSLAIELAEHGIRVVAIAPGFISTPLTEPYLNDPDMIRFIEATTPIGRFGSADDIARTVEFIVDPAASFITGTTISVDGGLLAGMRAKSAPTDVD